MLDNNFTKENDYSDLQRRIIEPEQRTNERGQIKYPLDLESEASLKKALEKLIPEMNRQDSLTITSGVTTFAVSSNLMSISGTAAVTISTITNGFDGQLLILIFTDTNVTITDDNTHTTNTIDLSAAFASADDRVLQLIYDGTSWYEVARSTN